MNKLVDIARKSPPCSFIARSLPRLSGHTACFLLLFEMSMLLLFLVVVVAVVMFCSALYRCCSTPEFIGTYLSCVFYDPGLGLWRRVNVGTAPRQSFRSLCCVLRSWTRSWRWVKTSPSFINLIDIAHSLLMAASSRQVSPDCQDSRLVFCYCSCCRWWWWW